MQLNTPQRGFTLVELAVVLFILGLLISSAVVTLSAQTEQRNFEETQRRLNAAVDTLLAYAIVNGRLPCPAVAGATGVEALTGANCTTNYGGRLPARTIGFQPADASGYAQDVWGNQIRYAVAQNVTTCAGPVNPHFTSAVNLKANGISCRPNDLDLCADAACASRVVSTQTVAFIVYSTGRNGAMSTAHGADETENTDGDARFVTRPPTGTDGSAGTYDDIVVFVPVGVLYSKLISAGILP